MKRIIPLLVLCCSFSSGLLRADASLETNRSLDTNTALITKQREIQHLLDFVASTNCLYERNGEQHTGKEAVEHIQKKYAYFEEDIQTTEDFIAYSATKSTLSGNAYRVHCPEQQTINSSEWLLQELKRFRRQLQQRPSE